MVVHRLSKSARRPQMDANGGRGPAASELDTLVSGITGWIWDHWRKTKDHHWKPIHSLRFFEGLRHFRCYFVVETHWCHLSTVAHSYSVIGYPIPHIRHSQPTPQTNTVGKQRPIRGREWYGIAVALRKFLYNCAAENIGRPRKFIQKNGCQGASTYSPVTAATNLTDSNRLSQGKPTCKCPVCLWQYCKLQL